MTNVLKSALINIILMMMNVQSAVMVANNA